MCCLFIIDNENTVTTGIFKDDECEDVIVTNEDFKCMTINRGPSNAEECFEDGFVTNPTYFSFLSKTDDDGNVFTLEDPCIANDGEINTEGISCNCESDIIQDFDMDWLNNGYNDSNWMDTTVYSESDICPTGCRRPDTLECSGEPAYCAYDSDSWGESDFIWGSDVFLDNIVLCRYEYQATCDSSESSSESSGSSDSSESN